MKGHNHPHMRHWKWLVPVGLFALVAHSTIPYCVLSHTGLSAAWVSGMMVLIVIKHLGLFSPPYALFHKRLRITK